jgi:hypothetical protein
MSTWTNYRYRSAFGTISTAAGEESGLANAPVSDLISHPDKSGIRNDRS